MDIVISGASGLIGTALRRSLEGDGHRVRRLVRRPPQNSDEIEWDPVEGTLDPGALDGVEAAVHLAGAGIAEKRWTPERKLELLESRTHGTVLLSGALAKLDHPPAVLVSASGMDWYAGGEEPCTEGSPAGDRFLSKLCAAWEAATAPATDAGIRTAHIRTSMVLSPDGGTLKALLRPFRLGLGGRMGDGRTWWSWISLTDEVRAIRFLIDQEVAGPVNLAAPHPVRNAEFAATLGRVLRRPAVLPIPPFAPKLIFGSEFVDGMILHSQRIEPKVLRDNGFTFRHHDLEAALRAELGRPA